MISIKCPHCGLVNFSAAGNCKRCQNDLAATADSGSSRLAPDSIEESSFRFQSDYPLAAWLLTLVLLISNTSLSYAIAGKGQRQLCSNLGGGDWGCCGLAICPAGSLRCVEEVSGKVFVTCGYQLWLGSKHTYIRLFVTLIPARIC